MSKNLAYAAAVAACLIAGLSIVGNQAPSVVHADTKSCDATSFTGAYGYSLNGYVYDNQGYSYYLGAAGRMVADGNGNISGADTFSFDGSVGKRTYSGTYTINSDCTGSLTFTTSGNNTTHVDLVLVNNGKEVNLVQTDAGYIMTGILKQQVQ